MDKARQSGKPTKRRRAKPEEKKEEDKVVPVESIEEELPEATVEEFRAVEPPPPAEAEEKPYTIGTWRGRTQWKCKQCPWDTLEGEAAMLKHIASAHAPQPERKSIVLIADKSGRQIN